MPLSKPEDFGTSAEGWRQNDYCYLCFQGGEFIQPEMTLAEMIDLVTPHTAEATGMSETEARALTERTLPHLKRWR